MVFNQIYNLFRGTQTTTIHHLAIVMDSSGSMESMGSKPIEGINALLSEQKQVSGYDIRISLYEFNHIVNTIFRNRSLDEINMFPLDTFRPQGMTSLYDSMYKCIIDLEELDARSPTIVIFTDGIDNSSSKTPTEIRQLINRKRAENWKFVYMGCNQDAVEVGAALGINENECLTTSNDPNTQSTVWRVASNNINRTLTSDGVDEGFTEIERTQTAPAVIPN